MTPMEADTVTQNLAHRLGKDQPQAWSDLEAMLRRDWAVRVLDAWAEAIGRSWSNCPGDDEVFPFVTLRSEQWTELREGDSAAAARHAAALAVFPALDEAARAALGECP